MTKKEYDEKIATLWRRIEILRGAANGTLKLRRIHVEEYDVPAYTVPAHDRYLAPLRQKIATKRRKKSR